MIIRHNHKAISQLYLPIREAALVKFLIPCKSVMTRIIWCMIFLKFLKPKKDSLFLRLNLDWNKKYVMSWISDCWISPFGFLVAIYPESTRVQKIPCLGYFLSRFVSLILLSKKLGTGSLGRFRLRLSIYRSTFDRNFTVMIIHSLFGSFCVVANSDKTDGLLLQSNSKAALNRAFDDKRIKAIESVEYPFVVELCRQEFAHFLISMTKDISYVNFDREISELVVTSPVVSFR